MTLVTSAMLRCADPTEVAEKAKKPPKGTVANPIPGIDPFTNRPVPKVPHRHDNSTSDHPTHHGPPAASSTVHHHPESIPVAPSPGSPMLSVTPSKPTRQKPRKGGKR
jgi:hypothetical protein